MSRRRPADPKIASSERPNEPPSCYMRIAPEIEKAFSLSDLATGEKEPLCMASPLFASFQSERKRKPSIDGNGRTDGSWLAVGRKRAILRSGRAC